MCGVPGGVDLGCNVGPELLICTHSDPLPGRHKDTFTGRTLTKAVTPFSIQIGILNGVT